MIFDPIRLFRITFYSGCSTSSREKGLRRVNFRKATYVSSRHGIISSTTMTTRYSPKHMYTCACVRTCYEYVWVYVCVTDVCFTSLSEEQVLPWMPVFFTQMSKAIKQAHIGIRTDAPLQSHLNLHQYDAQNQSNILQTCQHLGQKIHYRAHNLPLSLRCLTDKDTFLSFLIFPPKSDQKQTWSINPMIS